MTIIFIFMFGFAVITYLFFLGASKCKSDYERELEDKEQMEYLKQYKNGGKKSGKWILQMRFFLWKFRYSNT